MLTHWLATRLAHCLPPEKAHEAALFLLEREAFGDSSEPSPPILQTHLLGLNFDNPFGLAAGFDKDARAVQGLFGLGFSAVEVGTVTPRPQPGNPRPRLFRLLEDEALINRLGFNNMGAEVMAERLQNLAKRSGVVGVNIGCNKDSEDQIADYRTAYGRLAPYADYLTINVSSPNTPGLRKLQAVEHLGEIVRSIREVAVAYRNGEPPPLLVKVAPDLPDEDVEHIAKFAVESQLSGLIISNTTIARPSHLRSGNREEAGGLSGKPLLDPSTRLLAHFYSATQGKIALIGVGGVFSAEDAYQKIRAGASFVQLYTGLIYRGPGFVAELKRGLVKCLTDDGFENVGQAVGVDSAEAGT